MERVDELRRRLDARSPAGAFAIAVVGVLVYVMLVRSPGFLDWDTYDRLRWIGDLNPAIVADGHILLHVVLHGLVAVGMDPARVVFAATAVGVGLLLAAATYVARARGLEGRALVLVVSLLLVASPGIVAMTAMAEDNVTYQAPLLLFLHWLTMPAPEGKERAQGAKAGVMLALAMLLNITSLIFLFLLPLAPVLWGLRRRGDALRLVVTIGTALAIYYLFYLVLYPEAPIAMHQFLPQALRAQDFEQSTAPLGSWARFEQYVGGFRAMALIPTIHRMELSNWLVPLVTRWVPLLLLAAYVVLAARSWRLARAEGPIDRRAALLTAAVATLTVVFPYFYEPALIERWDMLWLVLFLALVAVVRSELRAGAEVVLALAMLFQVAGSGLVLAHQLGRAYERPEEAEVRAVTKELQTGGDDPIVLPLTIDRVHLAAMVHRLPRQRIYLVGDEGGQPSCRRMAPRTMNEVNAACAAVAQHVRGAPKAYVDGRAVPALAAIEGPGSPP